MIYFLLCFFLGSIPFGLLVAKVFKVGDLRTKGSGNIGATNVTRVAGFWPAGFLTFLFDLLKGAVPLVILKGLSIDVGVDYFSTEGTLWWLGLAAVLGHCFSPWLGFNGGKGVATGLGVIAVLSPFAAMAGFFIFLATFLWKRLGSFSSISGLISAAIFHLSIVGVSPGLAPGAFLLLVILVRHDSNIDSLLANAERSF